MQKTLSIYDTTIGKKAIAAATGLILYGFVIVHMAGNLQLFLGPEKYNAYAAMLKATPALVWGARGVLSVSVLLHIATTLSLVGHSAGARPVGYRQKTLAATNYAAMTMRYGGPALALFILFHLAHFTFPGVAMGNYRHEHVDIYSNVVHGFSVPWVTLIYVAAQTCLGFHLYHGAWSLFQTLGISHPRYNPMLRLIPKAIGVGVAAGNIAMPLAVLAGVIR